MRIKLDTKKNCRSKNQDMKLKSCQFPKCKTKFLGRGKTKYCDEHRKQKYKKILYQRPISNGIGEANVIIKHKCSTATKIIKECDLDNCNCQYEITLIPNQIIYPKFCIEHRNKFKRDYFVMQQQKDKQNEI